MCAQNKTRPNLLPNVVLIDRGRGIASSSLLRLRRRRRHRRARLLCFSASALSHLVSSRLGQPPAPIAIS
uniref:Uncharacterized protein n=1 Tax=Leersia perrieri TaxID=77586 RepID=A0A0D9XES2_9ORYZ